MQIKFKNNIYFAWFIQNRNTNRIKPTVLYKYMGFEFEYIIIILKILIIIKIKLQLIIKIIEMIIKVRKK